MVVLVPFAGMLFVVMSTRAKQVEVVWKVFPSPLFVNEPETLPKNHQSDC